MPTQAKRKRRFVICIRTDDGDLLTPRRIYEVLSDEGAAKSKYIRVIDNGRGLFVSRRVFRAR